MKKLQKFYFVVILAVCFVSLAVLTVYAQGQEAVFTRQQRIALANEHYAKGKELNQQGDYAKANEEFQKAQDLLSGTEGAAADSMSLSAPVKVSDNAQEQVVVPAATKKKAKQEAKQKSKDAVKAELVPDDDQKQADNYFRMGLDFARKGQAEKAMAAYQEAINLTPNNAALHYNLAIEYLKLSKFYEAAEIFKVVVKLNPKDRDAYYNLGVLYDSYLNDKDLAKTYYNKYLKLATKADDTKDVKGWVAQIDKDKKEQQ